ncbi:hypothetical protein ACFSO7_09580 [Bacillus sp. CGMCC 1.16607]|uniref:hypothetical protein n=1 Tax=Bacillus sp. CGMCC 1.16607 TaxID=3351842 RepID=UPI00362EC57D
MECGVCGYKIDYEKENWIFFDYELTEPTYEITSEIFDEIICEQIINHALSLSYKPDTIYIDTWFPDTHLCEGCFEIKKNIIDGMSAKILEHTKLKVRFFF